MNLTRFWPTRLNVWPVVQRELREGARRPVNHRLRLFSAGGGTLLLWIVVAHSLDMSSAEQGGILFTILHTFLLMLILSMVPSMTADCIAREKRGGTLGLLFLTPLSAGGIVTGKALAQGLRAFTLWLAVLPILTVPFLTGGITWFDALSALSLEFCATVLCLAAGLLASSLTERRGAAFFLAWLLGVFFMTLFSQPLRIVMMPAWLTKFGFGTGPPVSWHELNGFNLVILCGAPVSNNLGGWSSLCAFSPGLRQTWTWLCSVSPVGAVLFFFVVARFAAWRVKVSWQDKVPSPVRKSRLGRIGGLLLRRQSRSRRQGTLDWNPIAWLQEYSPRARLSKWGLCLSFLLVEMTALYATQGTLSPIMLIYGPSGERIPTAVHMVLLWTLTGIYTFVAVSGFLEEKRSGALELLLVTPISVNKLIFGRVWGLWKQFLPAALVLGGFYMSSTTRYFDVIVGPSPKMEFIYSCWFLALPVFATYAALRVKNLIVATVLTWLALFLATAFALEFIEMFTDADEVSLLLMGPALLLSFGAFARLTCFLLRHSLSRRIYAF